MNMASWLRFRRGFVPRNSLGSSQTSPYSFVLAQVCKKGSSRGLTTQREELLAWCCCAGLPVNKPRSLHNVAASNPTVQAILLGPSVRRLLDSYGLDTFSIQPSGHKGQLLKGDVLKYVYENALAEIKFGKKTTDEGPMLEVKVPIQDIGEGYTDFGLTNVKRTMAERVTESKTMIPHVYSTIDCNMDKIFMLREKLRESNVEVSADDLIIKAVALTLRRVPEVNAYWTDNGPVQIQTVSIAVVVAGPHGLATPVISHADEMNVKSISSTVRNEVQRAKEGQLPAEPLGCSFTVSNLGTLGVKSFTAVISPPQAAALAIGQAQAYFNENSESTRAMTVTLCCDGRIVDEPTATKWLKEFQAIIENPVQMAL